MGKKKKSAPDIMDKIIAMAEGLPEPLLPDPPKTIITKALHSRPPDDARRIEETYIRMEIKDEDVVAFPDVADSFDDIGGIPAVVQYLRSSDAKEAKDFLYYWDMISLNMRAVVPFEAYCVAAKMTKKRLMMIVMGEVCEQSDLASTMLAAAAHPRIVKKTIEIAESERDGATEARKILHQHRGFLPTPKTQQVTIHGNVNQDNRQDNSQTANISLMELDKSSDKISRAVDRFNESKVIRDPDAEFIDVDVEE